MKEKTIKIPQWLHFLLGKKISIINLILISLFAVFGTAFIIYDSINDFLNLFLQYKIIYVLISVFTLFSVCTNISLEVSKIYELCRKRKWIYIFASIQPLIIMLMSNGTWWHFLFIYGYTSIASYVITFLKGRSMQKAVGFGVVAFALLMFAGCFQGMSNLYSILMFVHIFNVVFCVSVSQYLDNKYSK